MKVISKIQNRQSHRLRGYDYRNAGFYFITICCHQHQCMFGNIVNGQMMLNDSGTAADNCWLEIPKHFPHAVLHDHVIMPNHVHGIIELVYDADDGVAGDDGIAGADGVAGADGTVGPNDYSALRTPANCGRRSPSRTIGSIVRGFKIGVTKWMRANTKIHFVWQANYYDHIIRNDQSFQNIARYIRNNPAKWSSDRFRKI